MLFFENRKCLGIFQIFLACFVLTGSFCSHVRADIVTIGSTTSSATAPAQGFGLTSLGIAQSFNYSSNFTLTDLSLNLYNTSSSNAGTYTVSLYSGSLPSGAGTTLATGNWNALWRTNSSNVVSITGLSQSLTANQTYWISVKSDTSGVARNWAYNNSNLFGDNTTATNYAFYNGSTSTWSSQGNGQAMGMQITGTTSVPEPCTVAMFGLAMGGAALAAMRKRIGSAGVAAKADQTT